MDCKQYRNEIDEEGAAASAHASACAACRAFGTERESLRRLVSGLEKICAPPDFEFRLRARIDSESRARRRPFGWRGFAPSGAWVAVAGCLVLTVAVFTLTRRESPAGAGVVSVRDVASTPAAPTAAPFVASAPDRGDSQPRPARREGAPAGVKFDGPAVRVTAAGESPWRQRRSLPVERRHLAGAAAADAGAAALREAASRLESSEFSVIGEPIPVTLTQSGGALEVRVERPRGGGQRVVSVPQVVFGARDLTGARTSMRNASYTKDQGVW